MSTMCNVITEDIEKLATAISKSDTYTCNLVSAWQTKYNRTEYPTSEDLVKMLNSNKEEAWDIYFAVPNYKFIPYEANTNTPIIKHDNNGVITLMLFPEENALEYFFKRFPHIPELRSLVKNTTDGYRFMLWREMAFIQKGLQKTVSNGKIAEAEALTKLRHWVERHPVSVQAAPASVVQTYNGNWTRQAVANDPSTLYIFTDNTDRDSGSGIIPADSWYSKKYGTGHHFPTMTAAVIRGLDNARPISTQRWYHKGASGPTGRWNDADFEEFKKVVDDEFKEILREWETGKYKTIMFPQGDGLFNTRISQITMERTPKLYQYLQSKYQNLINSINGSVNNLPGPETKINIYAGTGENADLSNFAERPFVLTSALAEKLENLVGFPVFADKYYPDEGEEVKKKNTYNSVEQAFQIAKIGFAFDGTDEAIDNSTAEEIEHSIKESTPSKAKSLGRTIPMSKLAISNWDKFSSQIMKELIKASFEQNPQALQRLLATGNATLTHTQDKGEWGTEFPKLLMEVREELRQKNVLTTPSANTQVSQSTSATNAATQGNSNLLRHFAPTPTESNVKETRVMTQEEANDTHKVPAIGTEVIQVDADNPVAKVIKDLTPTERAARCELIARTFSDIVDEEVENKIDEITEALQQAKEDNNQMEIDRLEGKLRTFNDDYEGRKAIISEITLPILFDRLKERFNEYLTYDKETLDSIYGEGKGAYIVESYRKMLDNWEVLLSDACPILEDTENMRIITTKHAYNDGTRTTSVLDGIIGKTSQEAAAEEAAFNDDEDGHRVDGNGGWSFKIRFTNPVTSLSKNVKKVLSNILKEGVDGTFEKDDLGNLKHLNKEYVHAVLINELSNMVNADDFCVKDAAGNYTFPALEKVAKKYPWATQIINTLKADPSLVGSFYADFRKDFISYWTQIYDPVEGKWKTLPLNKAVALDSTMTNIIRNYEQGTVLHEDSIYDTSGKINKEALSKGTTLANDMLAILRNVEGGEFEPEDYKEFLDLATRGLQMVGLNANKYIISNKLSSQDSIKSLTKVGRALQRIFNEAGKLSDTDHLINSLDEDYKILAEELGEVFELDNVQSFRVGDKTYYSYSAPNYIDTLVKIFKDDTKRDAYLEEQYGKYWWFKTGNEWNSEWLSLIEKEESVRYQMGLKDLNNINGTEYEDWTPNMIREAFIREYFSVPKNPQAKFQYAWYNFPIFSDSPVCKFIKFVRYTDTTTSSFEKQILPLLNKVVKQEIERIKVVKKRKTTSGISEISNFDTGAGEKFQFFPELNSYDKGEFLNKVTNLVEQKDMKALDDYIDTAVSDIMDKLFREYYDTLEKSGIEESLQKDGVLTEDAAERERAIKEYFWNQAYATTQIIELVTTDLAFYKNGVDFQKRFKEAYAAGIKLNTNSKYGKVFEKSIYLKDQIIVSATYNDIKKSLDKAVALGHIKSYDRDNILNKFKGINVADGQSYRHPKSMRAVLDMMGAWTNSMEESLNRFEQGQWDMADFNTVWQTIKPFLYTQIEKSDGLGGSIKVPHQNKNSEFLLLAAYNMVAASMNKSPKLRALTKFMDKYDIDVAQFESSVKNGCQGTVNLNYSEKTLNAWIKRNPKFWEKIQRAALISEGVSNIEDLEADTFDVFEMGMLHLLETEEITQEEYNKAYADIEPDEDTVFKMLEEACFENGEEKPNVVHKLPYADYMIAQPTPEHLFDCVAVFGSQLRNLGVSDMPDDPNFRVTINGRQYTKEQVLSLYNSLIVENLLDDFTEVRGRFSKIEDLQQALLNIIKGNPKYSSDMYDALQLVEIDDPRNPGKKTKVFNIPLDNPSTTTKLQEIITSMFKNAITKQHIKGGACILVSDYGLTDELKIVHNDDGSIKYIECYLPAYSKQFYDVFAESKVNKKTGEIYKVLDINKMPEDLRKLVGYRIPTEDKYSMAPLYIKGFLPQQNGSCIMLPADITQIAGSDFDVDKMFLMIPEFKIENKYRIKAAWDDFYKSRPDIVKNIDDAQWEAFVNSYNETAKLDPEKVIDIDPNDEEYKNWFVKESGLKNYEWVKGVQEEFSKWFEPNKKNYFIESKAVKIQYDINKAPQEQSRKARNNMLIDILYGVLTNKDTAEKIHNPGSFDKAKIASRIATILDDAALVERFAETIGAVDTTDNTIDYKKVATQLLNMSETGNLKALDKFLNDVKIERSQLTPETFIYNHVQNTTGGKLIGMYANNTTMQAKYQRTDLAIADEYKFLIDGHEISSLHAITSPSGERISKNCAEFSAASVDNVKDPVLAELMQNTKTANITGFMLRAGMSIQTIGLLFSQPFIRSLIKHTGSLESLKDAIEDGNNILEQLGGRTNINIEEVRTHNFTSRELLMNILEGQKAKKTQEVEDKRKALTEQIKVAILMYNIMSIAQDVSDLTKISRADSPNGAINISIAGAKNQVRRVELFKLKSDKGLLHITGIDGILRNEYIYPSMDKNTMRNMLNAHRMPILQAFYSLGIELASSIMSEQFSIMSPYVENLVKQIYVNSDKGIVSDKALSTFYDEFIEFALSGTKFLGDDGNKTFEEKRDYYLYKYPDIFTKTVAENPDIANLGIIKKLQVDSSGDIVMKRSGRLTPAMKAALMRDFDTLLYMDNPVATRLAIDLFAYSYYKDGFKFGPNNFGTFFSSTFISSFPEFINTLRELKFNNNGTYFDEFLTQFYLNHVDASAAIKGLFPSYSMRDLVLSNIVDVIEAPNAKTVIFNKRGFVLNKNLPKGDRASYKYIMIDNELYCLQGEASQPVYTRVPIIQNKGKRNVMYNANKKALTLAEDSSKIKWSEKSTSQTPNSKGTTASVNFDFDIEAEFGPEFGSYNDEISKVFSDDDFSGMSAPEDISKFMGKSQTTDYDINESQDLLDTPLCIGKK